MNQSSIPKYKFSFESKYFLNFYPPYQASQLEFLKFLVIRVQRSRARTLKFSCSLSNFSQYFLHKNCFSLDSKLINLNSVCRSRSQVRAAFILAVRETLVFPIDRIKICNSYCVQDHKFKLGKIPSLSILNSPKKINVLFNVQTLE